MPSRAADAARKNPHLGACGDLRCDSWQEYAWLAPSDRIRRLAILRGPNKVLRARLADGRVARLATELLSQLSLGNADCAARHSKWPAQAGFFPDCDMGLMYVEEGLREYVGIIEVFDESIGDALLTGRTARTSIAAVLGDQQHLASVGDRLEKNVVEGVGNTTEAIVKTLQGISHPLRVERQILSNPKGSRL